MRPSKQAVPFPLWVRIICCLVPICCILALSVGSICGAHIPWHVATAVSGLCAYIIKAVV